jgi:hypothetical protein
MSGEFVNDDGPEPIRIVRWLLLPSIGTSPASATRSTPGSDCTDRTASS